MDLYLSFALCEKNEHAELWNKKTTKTFQWSGLTYKHILNLVTLIKLINVYSICNKSLSIAYCKTNSNIDSYVKYRMAFVLI